MGGRYEIWLVGPNGAVLFATALSLRDTLKILQKFNEWCDENEVGPDLKRIVVVFPEGDKEEKK